MNVKKCSDCGELKEIIEFYKYKKGKDGFRASCKQCFKERAKSYHIKNKDKIQQYKKEYYIRKKNIKPSNSQFSLYWQYCAENGHQQFFLVLAVLLTA